MVDRRVPRQRWPGVRAQSLIIKDLSPLSIGASDNELCSCINTIIRACVADARDYHLIHRVNSRKGSAWVVYSPRQRKERPGGIRVDSENGSVVPCQVGERQCISGRALARTRVFRSDGSETWRTPLMGTCVY